MNRFKTLQPFDYQKEGIEFALDKRYSINGFTMGLGKTVVGIGLCLYGAKRPLIVVPAYLMQNWKDEFEKFAPHLEVKLVKTVIDKLEGDVHVVSYASFMKCHKVFDQFDALIADEIQYLKNRKAKRTQYIHSYLHTHRPYYTLGLSGTPIKNAVQEWWSPLKIVHYGEEYPQFDKYQKSEWLFASDFCNREHVWGGKYKFVGLRNRKELVKLLKPIYLRKRSSEVLELPEVSNNTIKLGSKSKFDKDLKEAWESQRKRDKDKVFATIKADSALHKVPATVAKAREIMDSGFQVVVFTCHVESAKALAESLNGKLITGATPSPKRATFVKEFNDKNFQCLVGTVGSMSTGFNLTSANHMIFNDLPWVPSDYVQAKKRIHRIGQDKRCFYYVMIMSDIDYQIYQTILKKAKVLMEAINV